MKYHVSFDVDFRRNKEKNREVLEGYDWLFGRFKKEITVIDATLPIEEVTNKMIKIIDPLLLKRALEGQRKNKN